MSNKKPSYIGMLNAISNGERRGYEFLSAWADATSSTEVGNLLRVVAIREAEHAWAFEKRLCELGYSLIEKKNTNFKKTIQTSYRSTACLSTNHKIPSLRSSANSKKRSKQGI